MSKRFALLVGMTAYQDDRLGVTTTSKDIRTLVERLRDPENGRFDRVVPLLNQTALDLQLGIASFFEQTMEPGDLVLVYFAGHSLIHHQNIYLATTDTFTEEYLDATTVEIDFVRRRLNVSPAQQVVLLDCDFSFIGATDRHINGFGMLSAALKADNRAVLISPQLTDPLVDGLQGPADADEDGTITFLELRDYVQNHLPETEPATIATNEELDNLSLAFCAAAETTAPAIPLVPPPTSLPTESTSPPSKQRRYGIAALVLLLLLIAFGFFAVSRGMFSGDGLTDAQPEISPTTAVAAILPEASETPSTTPTTEAQETAVIDHTSTTEATNTPQATETVTNTPTATATKASPIPSLTPEPTVTEGPTPTAEPTATSSPTPGPRSEPVPMDVVAQQAFLRAGPGINYRILDFPTRGTAVTIIARDSDATWYNAVLDDGTTGWLHKDVLAAAEDAFDAISVAATIPVPSDDFYDPILTPSGDGLSLQIYHTYVGTRGDNARLQARLLPETDLIQPTYLSGQELGLGLLIVAFNRVRDGDYTSEQVELCMVSEAGVSFYCETVPARKSW